MDKGWKFRLARKSGFLFSLKSILKVLGVGRGCYLNEYYKL